MMLKNNLRLILLGVLLLSSCATYEMELLNSKVPVYLTDGSTPTEGGYRRFRFQRQLTWVFFDTINTEKLDLDKAIAEELPKARKIINLRIHSLESPVDSVIRVIGTFIQYLLVTDRSLISRRTVTVEGEVLEQTN